MGTQGEIYNVLGIKLPAEVVKKDRLYRVNGIDIFTDTEIADELEDENKAMYHGIPTYPINLTNPNLIVRLDGYIQDEDLKGRHFKNSALIGYVIANESYEGGSTELPDTEIIDDLKGRLFIDIKNKFNYDATEEELKLYLVFDWINGH